MRYENLRKPLTLLAATVMFAVPATLSDPVAIYAVIDKVVFTPETNPTSIQIWGTFAMSDQQFGDNYTSAGTGYLYYSVNPSDARTVRAEWNDLKSLAGKKTIVAFGGKYVRTGLGRVRCPTEAPANPDPYPASNLGVTSAPAGRNTGWPIAKQVLDKQPTAKCGTGR